ncbi:hypothetical protein Tco_0889828 [Tanacetum coccineum]
MRRSGYLTFNGRSECYGYHVKDQVNSPDNFKHHPRNSSGNFNTQVILRVFQICTESSERQSAQCKVLGRKDKRPRDKDKDTRGSTREERHPEKHTLDSAAILHEAL